jgi:pilus assembly protein CpaF
MVSMANSGMQMASIRQQIASSVNLLIQAARLSDGSRRVTSITEITGMEGSIVSLQEIFAFEKQGLDPDRRVKGRFLATGVRPKFSEKLQAQGIHLPLELFSEEMQI